MRKQRLEIIAAVRLVDAWAIANDCSINSFGLGLILSGERKPRANDEDICRRAHAKRHGQREARGLCEFPEPGVWFSRLDSAFC